MFNIYVMVENKSLVMVCYNNTIILLFKSCCEKRPVDFLLHLVEFLIDIVSI